MNSQRRHALEIAVLVTLLVIAFILRAYRISEYMTFLGDEGRDALVVKRMIIDHKLTLLGPTSSVGGFFLGPAYYYLMAPFLWAWNLDPTGPAVMVSLFGTATVYLIYRIGREWFGTVSGFLSSMLYAVSPLVILYSRSSWNPNIVPFFACLFMYSVWKALHQGQRRYFALAGISLGIGLQLHYVFLFLVGASGLYGLLYGRNRSVLAGVPFLLLGFGAAFSPFLLFELRHAFPNTQTIFRFLLHGEETGFSAESFFSIQRDLWERSFGRLLFRLPEPQQFPGIPAAELAMVFAATKTMIAASAAGLLIGTWSGAADRRTARSIAVLMALWIAVPVTLFGFYRKGIYDYYFGIFFPVPFLLFGYLASILKKVTIGKIVVIGAFTSMIAYNLRGIPFRSQPNRQLEQAKSISRAVWEEAGGQPFNFALLADHNSDHAYRYFLEIWGNPPVVIENPSVDPDRTTVTDQLLVVCELAECRPLGHPLWEIAGFGSAEIVSESKISFVTIYRMRKYNPDTPQ